LAASHLASTGSVSLRQNAFIPSGVSVDAVITPLGTTPPTLSSLASSLNQSSIGYTSLPSAHMVATKTHHSISPGQSSAAIGGILSQVANIQSQAMGSRPTGSSVPLGVVMNNVPQVVQLSTLANQWLGPETNQTVCTLCPEANSLLHLFGAWLFEASVAGVEKDLNSKSKHFLDCCFFCSSTVN
uniref:POU domain, class 2, transcription factor 1 n=1 Tax=Echinostoma caproni TaxID=27848 RepID=A0A183BEK1_9TREM